MTALTWEVSHVRGPNAAENLAERDKTNSTHEERTGYGGRCLKGLCNSEKPQLQIPITLVVFPVKNDQPTKNSL